MKLVARDYQVEAIEAICKSLNEQNRVTAVMACGTGKTLVSLWAAEKMGVQTIVVFMPSLMLIKQIIDTWTEQTEWPWYSYMAVCCDDKLLDDDLIDIDAKECCFDVCIDEEQVRTFIGRTEIEEANRSVHIVFCTYQSSHIIPKDVVFDLGIFDEAHKTAHKDMGSFRYALYDENVTIKKRLFLTATPRHYQLKGKTTHLEYSMSNEKVYGPVVYRLDFAQAIKRGIICDYKILITIMDDKLTLEGSANKLITADGHSFNMQMMANVIACRQALDKFPIKRAVAFHRTIKDTKEFSRTARHLRDMQCNILDINSHMNSDERRAVMRAFEYSSKAIISNARCLSEGVDIPSIDLVAFLSPKKSKIDIVQAVGRVMRNAPGKEFGYILLPIYVKEKWHAFNDIADSSEYRYIMEILNALREYDTDLQQQISDGWLSREKYEKRQKNKIEFVNVDINSNELEESINIDILERFKDDWDVRFEEIKKWYQERGSWVINGLEHNQYDPTRGWINWQRTAYKNGQLSDERLAKLRSINFVFDATADRYWTKFERFKEIIEKHGLKKTLRQYDPSVDNWYQFIKLKIKNNISLPIIEQFLEYIKKYPNYEECLELQEPRLRLITNRNIAELTDYYAKHGDIDIHYNDNKNLAKWLDSLHKGRYCNLSEKTKQLLIEMGFIYRAKEAKAHVDEWNKNFALLQEYKKIEPDLIFHKEDEKWQGLNRWVVRQRDKYRSNGKFLPGHKEKLISIGLFNGNKKRRWKKTKDN